MLLCLSVAGAILRPLPERAFWLGFAIFGWSYWFVEFNAMDTTGTSQYPVTRWLGSGSVVLSGPSYSMPPARPSLLTRELIGLVEANLSPNRKVGAKVQAQWRNGTYYPGTITQINGTDYLVQWDDGSAPQWTPSHQIAASSPSLLPSAHALLGGFFALVGGVLVALVFAGRKEATKAAPETTPTK
jgi:hypothetical protein